MISITDSNWFNLPVMVQMFCVFLCSLRLLQDILHNVLFLLAGLAPPQPVEVECVVKSGGLLETSCVTVVTRAAYSTRRLC